MLGRRVVFQAKGKAGLETYEVERPQSDQILIETLYSTISPGTERAFLLAAPNTLTHDKGFPFYPGYSNVGRVIEAGPEVKNYRVGDFVATTQTHCSHIVAPDTLGPGYPPDKYRSLYVSPYLPDIEPQLHLLWKLPGSATDDELKAYASFSIWVVGLGGARKPAIEIGETVLVIGLGAIGLSAAVHARLAGAFPLLGLDPSPARRELARKFGFDGIYGSAAELAERHPLMRKKRPEIVIEATGKPEVIPDAFRLCADHGRVVLLSSTRGITNGIDFYTDVHRKGLTVYGAHETVRPIHENRPGYWTTWDDREAVLRLMRGGRLPGSLLISHKFPVEQASEAYTVIANEQAALSVLLKW